MALVVPTPPPDLVVKTKVKKGRTRVHESPVLCDSFWACVLDDYLDDDTDSGIVEASPPEDSGRKHRSKKKRESSKKKYRDSSIEPSEESDKQALGKELENLLADDHAIDHRENEMIVSPPSNDIVSDILKQDEETEPEEETDRMRKQDKRVQSNPVDFEEPAFYGVVDSDSEQEGRDSSPERLERRARVNGDVFHYAPLGRGEQSGKNRLSHGHSNRRSRDLLPANPRISIEPEDDQRATSRTSRFRGGDQPDYSRDSRIVRPIPHRAGQLPSRRTHASTEKKTSSRVDTIDLTNEAFRSPSFQGTSDERTKYSKTAEAFVSSVGSDEPSGWATRENKRGEADYRRRKLDRKEALDRIRAIKARLNTVDP